MGAIIRGRRRELGLTLQRLADAVGCHKSYLSQIETGRRVVPPSAGLLDKLERSLRFPAGTLAEAAHWQTMPGAMRAEVRELRAQSNALRAMREALRGMSLDEAWRTGSLQAHVERLAGSEGSGGGSNLEMVGRPMLAPIVNKVAAGYPTEFTDLGYPARVADAYVAAPDLRDPDAFAARVVGDSMEPEYREGDIVVFSPERSATDGSDCFVRLERDAETTFKRVYVEGEGGERIRLQPLNSRYPPRTVAREEIAGLYVAVWVVRAAPGARG